MLFIVSPVSTGDNRSSVVGQKKVVTLFEKTGHFCALVLTSLRITNEK
ncbi:hypothetical protein AVEN_197098-1, partial [Araneus ventricosus]